MFKINRTIKLLLLSSLFLETGFGLIEPILAIYIKDNLIGGTIFSAGLASTIFLLTKSLVQLPFSYYVDKHDDKVRWLVIGTALIAIVPFLYIFSSHMYAIYAAQFIHGIGAALAYPTWLGLWSLSLDKQKESFEWSLYSTTTGIGAAFTASIGAALAQFTGFVWTFAIVGGMSVISCIILFGLEQRQAVNSSK